MLINDVDTIHLLFQICESAAAPKKIYRKLVPHHPTCSGKEKERGHPAPRQEASPPAPPLPKRSLDFVLETQHSHSFDY